MRYIFFVCIIPISFASKVLHACLPTPFSHTTYCTHLPKQCAKSPNPHHQIFIQACQKLHNLKKDKKDYKQEISSYIEKTFSIHYSNTLHHIGLCTRRKSKLLKLNLLAQSIHTSQALQIVNHFIAIEKKYPHLTIPIFGKKQKIEKLAKMVTQALSNATRAPVTTAPRQAKE